ncbi:MAG: transposase [Curvibacter sp.]|nr:MAG: transposase [Curvibacter sp.]
MDILMGAIKGGTRRKHSDEFKAQVMAACRQPGASVAGVARTHQLNANLVSIWLRQDRDRRTQAHDIAGTPTNVSPRPVAVGAQQFVALHMAAVAQDVHPDRNSSTQVICVEWQRGDAKVTVSWPCSAAGDCAAWLKALLP